MSTQINIIDNHRQDKVKKNPIEFKYALNQVKSNYPDILRPTTTREDSPKDYNFIDLICKNYLSGCKLTWLYFQKNIEYPSVVKYIGDRDVFDFSNQNTEEYCVGLNHYVKDLDENKRLEIIKELLKSNEKDDVFINIGSHLITEYENEAMEICNNYSFDKYNELSIIDIKCYNTTLYKYIIEHLQQNTLKYNDCDILRILHIEKENQKTYSLRSLKENIKVDEMARFYGGNGHEKAAGYSINN
jgi:hypothetical protein